MVNANAKVVENSIFQQTWSAAGIVDGDAVLIGSIDALVFPFRNVDPQIARNRDERDLSIIGAQNGNDHRICAEAAAGSSIRPDQQEVDRLLSIVEYLTSVRVNGGKRCDR